jgi:hypothetical protein
MVTSGKWEKNKSNSWAQLAYLKTWQLYVLASDIKYHQAVQQFDDSIYNMVLIKQQPVITHQYTII